ncbi:MAG TPA: amidohydrolase, partial [Streptosporangiaceae bacterium]|nr:amidohydrolase [Streptosporangiaceae bacterium]
MIIDAHAHVWPDHIAPRILATRPAGLDPQADGTLDGLRRTMDAAGIDMALTLGIAGVPQHVARTNEFIGS